MRGLAACPRRRGLPRPRRRLRGGARADRARDGARARLGPRRLAGDRADRRALARRTAAEGGGGLRAAPGRAPRAAGIEIVELDGSVELDLAIDGADELDSDLRLIKGGGGALLREKIVISAARRFVVVAETPKLVERLGESFRLPVEVVRFAWRDTRRRLALLLPDAELRDGRRRAVRHRRGPPHPRLRASRRRRPRRSSTPTLERGPGVVEHGLFIGMAERALLGTQAGTIDVLTRP